MAQLLDSPRGDSSLKGPRSPMGRLTLYHHIGVCALVHIGSRGKHNGGMITGQKNAPNVPMSKVEGELDGVSLEERRSLSTPMSRF